MSNTNSIMSLIATSSSRIKDLVIKNGQLIFIQDLQRIALDFNGKRVFYNQITALDTEAERTAIENPIAGYYFVVNTAVMWYNDGSNWIQITNKPEEIVFVGIDEMPALGQAKTLYVDKEEKEISVWCDETKQYITVANCTKDATEEDIENLFK